MNNRLARVPNIESAERRQAHLEREAIRAEHRAFLDYFDRQVAELEVRDRADRNRIARSIDVQSLQRDDEH